jgi:hypothetical protein
MSPVFDIVIGIHHDLIRGMMKVGNAREASLAKDTLERSESYSQDLLIIILKVGIFRFRNTKTFGLMIETDKACDMIEILYGLADYKRGVSSENTSGSVKIQKIVLSCQYDEVVDDFGCRGAIGRT